MHDKTYEVQKIVKFRMTKRLAGHRSYDDIELQLKWVGFPSS